MSDHRQPKGIPAGGEFAAHDRADADVTLTVDGERPMPEVMSKVTYRGVSHTVLHVDGRTAVLQKPNGEVFLATGSELGLDKPAEPAPLPETLRNRRGHKFYTAEMKKWPALGTHDSTPLAEIPIVAHYFSPNIDWYVAEGDPATGRCWGYVRHASMPEGAEWGYFDLPELERIYPNPLYIVERDCYFTKGAAGEVIEK